MLRQIITTLTICVLAIPSMTSAQIYQGSGYSIDLLGKNWEYTPPDSESMETYSLGNRMIQVFPTNQDVYNVMISGNKKSIAYILQAYKNSVGSTDMKPLQSRKTMDGMVHYATFSAQIPDSDTKFYGALCIVSDKNLKSSRMVNIIDLTRAVKSNEAIKICSSIQSL